MTADDDPHLGRPPALGGLLRRPAHAAVLHAAVYEGLAADAEEAEAAIRAGRIRLAACHDHGCVGSVAGIYTASMPVFVVENARYGNRGFCNLYEGESRKRLNYGVYDDDVAARPRLPRPGRWRRC